MYNGLLLNYYLFFKSKLRAEALKSKKAFTQQIMMANLDNHRIDLYL